MKILFLESMERYESYGLDVTNHNYYFHSWCALNPFFGLGSYDIVVSTLSHNVYLNYIIRRARNRGVTTVLLVDGIFEYSNSFSNPFLKNFTGVLYRPNFHEYILVASDKIARNVISFGGGKVRPIINRRVWDGSSKPNDMVVDSGNVLITTANSPCFSKQEFDDLVDMIKEVVKALELQSIDYAFRIFDSELSAALNIKNNKNDIGRGMDEIIQEYTHFISTPSSICLKVMSASKPLAQFIYRDAPSPFLSGWTFFPGMKFGTAVANFMKPDIERLNYQSSVVASFQGADINDELRSIYDERNAFSPKVGTSYIAFILSNFPVFIKLKNKIKKMLKSRS